MKKILISLSIMLLFVMSFTSCVTSATVAADEIYSETTVDESIYYNDALYVDYEIVWAGSWPYWYRNNVFIPYHHTHVLHRHPRHFERRPYKPHLVDNHYHHRHQKELHHSRHVNRHNQRGHGNVNRRPSNHNGHPNSNRNDGHHNNHGHNNRAITPNTRMSHPMQHPQKHSNSQPQTRHTTPHSNTRTGSSPGSRTGSSPGSHSSHHSGSRGGRR
mgnify:CR=1 FL=1